MNISYIVMAAAAMAVTACSGDNRADRLKAAGDNPSLEDLMKVADKDAGARIFRQCAACHTISIGAIDKGGPNLHNIMGKKLGEASINYSYSSALLNHEGVWDVATMNAWIERPAQLVPKTKMIYPGIADPLARADLIAYLQSESE